MTLRFFIFVVFLSANLAWAQDEEVLYLPEEDPLQSHEPSQADIFSGLDKNVAFHLGQSQAWQIFSVSAFKKRSESQMLSLSVGTGLFDLRTEDYGRKYKIKTEARGIAAGGVWYPFKKINLSWELGVELSQLSGSIQPLGDAREDEPSWANRLESTFRSNAISFTTQIGWQYFYNERFYLHCKLFGLEKTLLWGLDPAVPSSRTKTVLQNKLEDIRMWGIMNLGFGLYF